MPTTAAHGSTTKFKDTNMQSSIQEDYNIRHATTQIGTLNKHTCNSQDHNHSLLHNFNMPPSKPTSMASKIRPDLFGTSKDLPRIVELDVAKINPNPNQPRKFFDETSLPEKNARDRCPWEEFAS